MRLIDSEEIKIPKNMVHNIDGCLMVKVEDMQRVITAQPTVFHMDRVVKHVREIFSSACFTCKRKVPQECRDCYYKALLEYIIEIIQKGK